MKITVYCLKGSAGKTPIAVNIALDKGYAIGTNEPYNLLDTVIAEESLMTVEPSEKFPDFGDEIDIVFDLAGMITHDAHNSIISAIEQSDVILVPIYNELKCLNAGINTLRELQHHTKNVVVVATKLQKGSKEFFSDWRDSQDFKNIASVVENSVGQGIPIFPLKFSKVFDTIFEKEQSIGQLRASSGLEAYTYREPAKQFDDLFTYLEKHYAK